MIQITSRIELRPRYDFRWMVRGRGLRQARDHLRNDEVDVKRMVCGLALAALAGLVQAQVYKCDEGGRKVFSDVPCLHGAEKVNAAPAAGYWDADSARRAQVQAAVLQGKVRRLEAIRASQVFVGMTHEDVIESWGRPSSVNRDLYAGVAKEQWVYDRGSHRRQYVYVENGIVTAIQDR